MYQWMHENAENSRLAALTGEKEIISELGDGVGFSIEEAKQRARKFRREIEELRKQAARLEENEAALLSMLAQWEELENRPAVPEVAPEDEHDALLDVFDAHAKTGGKPFLRSEEAPDIPASVSRIFSHYGLKNVVFVVSPPLNSGDVAVYVLRVPAHRLKIGVVHTKWHDSDEEGKPVVCEHELEFEEIERLKASGLKSEPELRTYA